MTRKPSPDVAPTRRPVRFGFLGRLHPSKGLTELARAVAAMPRDAEFRLEIRGPALDPLSRRYADELRALAANDPRVTFESAIAPSEAPAVLAGLDVLVIPSMWFENGPTTALEAMAVGTPIIASRVGNLAEIIDDGINGRLVAAGDVDALARALTEAAADPAHSIDVWRHGLKPPRTMDDVTRDYLSLYATSTPSTPASTLR